MTPNKSITEYLNYYFSIKESPGYAVLIRWKWWTGKTWFIKNYIEEHPEYSYIRVSLYGVSSFKDIEEAFFSQIHPLLGSKWMKFAWKILKWVLKTSINIDLNRDNKSDGNIGSSIPDVNLPDYFNKVGDRKIIFDDLERCSIEIPTILGYINELVETSGMQVIILANEEEILNSSIWDKYSQIKEKVIGKSLEVKVDYDNANLEFINSVTQTKKLLTKKQKLLREIFDMAGYDNLRHLRQAIFDFERFYNFLPQSLITKSDELLDHIIKIFFSISFELKKWTITEDQIKELFEIRFKNPKEEKNAIDILKNKYWIFELYHTPISAELWEGFYRHGTVNKDELKVSISNSVYFEKENTEKWIRLWHYYNLEDSELPDLYQDVYKDFKDGKINEKFKLLQITGILLKLSNESLIKEDKKSIIKDAKKNINNLKLAGKFKIDLHEEFPSNRSHGLQYSWLELEEMNEFLSYVEKEVTKSKIAEYPKIADNLLALMATSIDSFWEKIILSNSSKNEYYNTPILHYIDPQKFKSIYLNLNNIDKWRLWHFIRKRYQFDSITSHLNEELEWLKKIKKIFLEEQVKLKWKISGIIIQNNFLVSLEEAISCFKWAK